MVMGGLNAPVVQNIGANMAQLESLSSATARSFSNIAHHGFITVTPGAFQEEHVTHTKVLWKQPFVKLKKRPGSIPMMSLR
jgi:hypothetical protein